MLPSLALALLCLLRAGAEVPVQPGFSAEKVTVQRTHPAGGAAWSRGCSSRHWAPIMEADRRVQMLVQNVVSPSQLLSTVARPSGGHAAGAQTPRALMRSDVPGRAALPQGTRARRCARLPSTGQGKVWAGPHVRLAGPHRWWQLPRHRLAGSYNGLSGPAYFVAGPLWQVTGPRGFPKLHW